MEETRVLEWGQSMYGGWYANLLVNGKVTGIHSEKLKELRTMLAELGLKAENSRRWDN